MTRRRLGIIATVATLGIIATGCGGGVTVPPCPAGAVRLTDGIGAGDCWPAQDTDTDGYGHWSRRP